MARENNCVFINNAQNGSVESRALPKKCERVVFFAVPQSETFYKAAYNKNPPRSPKRPRREKEVIDVYLFEKCIYLYLSTFEYSKVVTEWVTKTA